MAFTSVWLGDPGPCPVDDAPHTTCTSPDYRGQSVTVHVSPPSGALRAAELVAARHREPVPTFTTTSYTRAAHKRKRGTGARD